MTFSLERTENHIRHCPKFVIISVTEPALCCTFGSKWRRRNFFALICCNFHMGRGASCALRSRVAISSTTDALSWLILRGKQWQRQALLMREWKKRTHELTTTTSSSSIELLLFTAISRSHLHPRRSKRDIKEGPKWKVDGNM